MWMCWAIGVWATVTPPSKTATIPQGEAAATIPQGAEEAITRTIPLAMIPMIRQEMGEAMILTIRPLAMAMIRMIPAASMIPTPRMGRPRRECPLKKQRCQGKMGMERDSRQVLPIPAWKDLDSSWRGLWEEI